MIRAFVMGGAVAVAALTSAPAAHAAVCERVAVTGILQSTPPQICVPWGGNDICDSGTIGIPGTLSVYKQICIPSVFGGR
ncbi:MAG TPA: hypothetical protein VFQ85_13315 [Mycobacteriales bacterium]|jgi:hypothetical protein|nr:hypothetical protein [Mycobacteriales bacterium]